MKQIYAIMGIVGVFLLILGAAGAYAYSNANTVGYGMMGNIDKETRDQMNTMHKQMMKNLDPETAKQMGTMHKSCMENDDGDE